MQAEMEGATVAKRTGGQVPHPVQEAEPGPEGLAQSAQEGVLGPDGPLH